MGLWIYLWHAENMYSFLCQSYLNKVIFLKRKTEKNWTYSYCPPHGDLERGPRLISLRVFKSFLMADPHC